MARRVLNDMPKTTPRRWPTLKEMFMRKLNSRIVQTVLFNLCVTTLALGCAEDSTDDDSASSTSGGGATNTSGLECSGEPEEVPSLADGSAISGDDAGLPFIGGVVTSVNLDAGSSAKLSVPELGTVCMSGLLTTEADNWGAEMVLGVASRANMGNKIVSLFDPGALGIAALRLRVDPPEGGRMTLMADVVTKCDCPEGPYACVLGGRYALSNPDHTQPVRFSEPTTVTAPLADFLPHDLDEPFESTTRLAQFLLHLEAPEQALDYEFCVSDVEFLDQEGNPIVPEG